MDEGKRHRRAPLGEHVLCNYENVRKDLESEKLARRVTQEKEEEIRKQLEEL